MKGNETPRWLTSVPLQRLFVRIGVLPFLLVIALIVFSAMSARFFTSENLITVARQATYLAIVAMGQMLALLTGGFDLSVGKIVAITSVITALTMAPLAATYPDATAMTLTLGILAGIGAGTLVGVVNGVGIAVFNVSPFMMTLGTAAISFGIALTLTSGVPVYGLPDAFGTIFNFSRILDIPSPVYVTAGLFLVMHIFLNRTRMGRYLYAVGGNLKASASLWDRHAVLPVLGLCAVRCSGCGSRRSVDGSARNRRGEYRRRHAA